MGEPGSGDSFRDFLGFLFDRDEERKARDAGIASSAEHAGVDWHRRAAAAFRDVLDRDGDVDTTRARELLASRGFPEAPEPRAWGAVVKASTKALGLRRTGWREAGSHGRPVAVWGRRKEQA